MIASLQPEDVAPAQRSLYSLGWLTTEINNGGFDQLFLNSAGDVVPDAVAAARSANANELADLVAEAMAIIGHEYSIERPRRTATVLAPGESDREKLSQLDDQSYDLESSNSFGGRSAPASWGRPYRDSEPLGFNSRPRCADITVVHASQHDVYPRPGGCRNSPRRTCPAVARPLRSGGMLVVGLLMFAACGGSNGASSKRGDEVEDAGPSETSTAASTSAALPEVKTDGGPYFGPLVFDWGTNCTVPVRETVLKAGSSATLSYGIELVAEGSNLIVSLVDMAVHDFNGEPVPSDQTDGVLAAFRLPSLVIDPTGMVVDVRGMQELLDQVQATLNLGDQVDSRQMAALMEDVVATKYWDTWAGFWAGVGSIDEARLEAVVPTPESLRFAALAVQERALPLPPTGVRLWAYAGDPWAQSSFRRASQRNK
jgi:hypothetical protein